MKYIFRTFGIPSQLDVRACHTLLVFVDIKISHVILHFYLMDIVIRIPQVRPHSIVLKAFTRHVWLFVMTLHPHVTKLTRLKACYKYSLTLYKPTSIIYMKKQDCQLFFGDYAWITKVTFASFLVCVVSQTLIQASLYYCYECGSHLWCRGMGANWSGNGHVKMCCGQKIYATPSFTSTCHHSHFHVLSSQRSPLPQKESLSTAITLKDLGECWQHGQPWSYIEYMSTKLFG